ncbi:MAG TPA: hypothetical protein DDX85_03645 [Nitrospiraceae bacterium]|nr:hypothetical protein [Nitrospiraceae bacterium]
MYARGIEAFTRSAMREIFPLTSRPGTISFARGLHSPDMFPLKDIHIAALKVLSTCSHSHT